MYMYVNIYIYICIYIYVCIYICIYIYINVYACIYAHIGVYRYTPLSDEFPVFFVSGCLSAMRPAALAMLGMGTACRAPSVGAQE